MQGAQSRPNPKHLPRWQSAEAFGIFCRLGTEEAITPTLAAPKNAELSQAYGTS